MALSTQDKNVLIASIERSLTDGKKAAGVVTLAAIDTEVAGLRTKFAADPDTVTGAEIVAANDKLTKLVFPRTDTIAAVFTEAKTTI